MSRQNHYLKIEPKYAQLRREGKKHFEIRKNDRDFRVGDMLHLQEYAPGFGYMPEGGEEPKGTPTEVAEIVWMTDFGMAPGYVCLATEP